MGKFWDDCMVYIDEISAFQCISRSHLTLFGLYQMYGDERVQNFVNTYIEEV